MLKRGPITSELERRIIIVSFLMVPVVLLITFNYIPAVKLLQLSFTDWNGYSTSLDYVGFENYLNVFTNREYYIVFGNNLAYVVGGWIMVVGALYLAIILDTGIRGRYFFRTLFFLPYVLNGVAVALMFSFFFDFQDSPVNTLLRFIGVDPIRFISNEYTVNISLSYVVVWRSFGFYLVLFLAALQSIPQEQFDNAKMDGAGLRQVIFYIIVPNTKRIIELSVFLSTAVALQVFYEPFLITHGGPAGRSHTFVSKVIDVAFRHNNFGKASAMGVVLLIILIIVTGLQRRALKGKSGHGIL
jgi:multiple sugar transport system permease protein